MKNPIIILFCSGSTIGLSPILFLWDYLCFVLWVTNGFEIQFFFNSFLSFEIYRRGEPFKDFIRG